MKVVANNAQIPQSSQNSATFLGPKLTSRPSTMSFADRLEDGLKQVSQSQMQATQLAKDYELGLENDLAKVMVGQQVSSLAFQLTLNVRNKALSAYKDIMNMPV